MGTFNCGAFVAGIVRVYIRSFLMRLFLKSLKVLLTICASMKGVLDSAGFPAVVTAHFVPVEGQLRPRTTILIKFADEVLATPVLTTCFFMVSYMFTVSVSSTVTLENRCKWCIMCKP